MALAEHVLPASADSGAGNLTQDQSAASLDEQTPQDARAGSDAEDWMSGRCAGALAEQAEADGATGLEAAPAGTELAGEAVQLEPEPAGAAEPEPAGAADPATAATQLGAGCAAGEAPCSAAERPHLFGDPAERDAVAPCQLQPHAGSCAADNTPHKEEAEGSRNALLTPRGKFDVAPLLAGREEVWPLAKRVKLLEDGEEVRDSEPRQGLIAAAYPADMQDGKETAHASAEPDPCGAYMEPAPAAEAATGAPAYKCSSMAQPALLAIMCVQGLEPAPGGTAHGGSCQPCGSAVPEPASLKMSWMAGSEGPPLLLQPAPPPPQPGVPAAAPPLTPLLPPALPLPTRVAHPPPPPPLLPFLLASSARRSSALALQGRGGGSSPKPSEAQRRARSATVAAARGGPAPAHGPGPCPNPGPRAVPAEGLSAFSGQAAAGGHAPDTAAAGVDARSSPSLGSVQDGAAAAGSQPDQAPESAGPALGGLRLEPGALPDPGVEFVPGAGEPALAPRLLARFRTLHWARLPSVAGSLWERLPAGGAALPPAAARALSELFATRRPGEHVTWIARMRAG